MPAFLQAVAAVEGGEAPSTVAEGTESLSAAAAHLASWDLRYDRDSPGPVLFEAAMGELADRLWDELEDEDGERVALPGSTVAWALLGQPESPWWDDRATDEVEDRDRILAASLEAAWRGLQEEMGAPAPPRSLS